MTRSLGWISVLVLVLAATAFAATGNGDLHSPPAEAFCARSLADLGATPTRCRPKDGTPDPFSVRVCGKFPGRSAKGAEETARIIEAALAGHDRSGTVAELGWESKGHRRSRWFRLAEAPVEISIDDRTGRVALDVPMRHGACLQNPVVPYGPERDGVSTPKAIFENVQDSIYPPGARRQHVPGQVDLEALIRTDGTVAELCVRDESPRGYGFAESAMRWYSHRRFEPATRDGVPIPYVMGITVRWSTN